MLIVNNSLRYSNAVNNPTEQRNYKNTFGLLTNFYCVELFQICSLSFVRLRPIQPSGYGEVCSLHIHFIDIKY